MNQSKGGRVLHGEPVTGQDPQKDILPAKFIPANGVNDDHRYSQFKYSIVLQFYII